MLRDKLGLPNPGGYPPAFVEHYPALAGVVETTADSKASLFDDAAAPVTAPARRAPAKRAKAVEPATRR
jgi:hypothetical protein